jgi:hypothetical protein
MDDFLNNRFKILLLIAAKFCSKEAQDREIPGVEANAQKSYVLRRYRSWISESGFWNCNSKFDGRS